MRAEVHQAIQQAVNTENALPGHARAREALQQNVGAAIAIVREHREALRSLRAIGARLQAKLERADVVGENVVLRSKNGDQVVQVIPSVREQAETYRSLAQAYARIIPMERQAFGLESSDSEDGAPDRISINLYRAAAPGTASSNDDLQKVIDVTPSAAGNGDQAAGG